MDEDTQRDPKIPASRDPSEVLHDALFDARIECDQLDWAIDYDDASDAIVAAKAAVRAFLNAQDALQRVHLRDAARQQESLQAQRAVAQCRLLLAAQFDRVLVRAPDSSLRRTLEKLRRALQPGAGEPAPRSPASDSAIRRERVADPGVGGGLPEVALDTTAEAESGWAPSTSKPSHYQDSGTGSSDAEIVTAEHVEGSQ